MFHQAYVRPFWMIPLVQRNLRIYGWCEVAIRHRFTTSAKVQAWISNQTSDAHSNMWWNQTNPEAEALAMPLNMQQCAERENIARFHWKMCTPYILHQPSRHPAKTEAWRCNSWSTFQHSVVDILKGYCICLGLNCRGGQKHERNTFRRAMDGEGVGWHFNRRLTYPET